MSEIQVQAIEKLEKENTAMSGGGHIGAMKNAVRDALIEFCKQDDEFAQAVVQGGRFKDCMDAVAKGAGSSLSDIEAYSKAVAFFFPGAAVHFNMEIDLCASVNTELPQSGKKDGILISLDSFF